MILDSQYRRLDSADEPSRDESLYCQTLSVQLKDDYCATSRRVPSVCLAIRRSSSSIIGRKELHIQLTDDADPFFFYTLTLTEDDFQSLKAQQGLLVDFLAFPQKFIDLLELCTKDEQKDENRRLEAALRSSETDFHSRLRQYQEMATERSRELDRIHSLHASQLASLREQHERELAAEKENVRKASSEQQFRSDLEHRETEQRLKKQIQVLEADVSIKETLNKDLQEKLSKSEQLCRELSLKVTALEAAVGQCQRTAEVLSREKDTVEADKQINEKDATSLRSQVDKLEAELSQKSQLLAETKQLLDNCEQKKRQVEALLEQRQAQLGRREAAVKTLSDDILKGNEIIKRLQAELRANHAKLRLRSEVITKQEDVLTEKEQQVQSLKRKLDDLELANKRKEAEMAQAQQRVEEVEQKLTECQKQVKTNENVIQWLNKQLNSYQLQQDKRGSPAGVSSSKQFTSPAAQQSPTYPTARNFAFPGTGGTTAPLQPTFPNMTPGVAQESPVLPRPIGDAPLVDPRFLQPLTTSDPTAKRVLNPITTATTAAGSAAFNHQRAPAASQAPLYHPATAKTNPS
nr:spindle assembly abnormal protein 6 homolog [Rhipicephalus microplus]